jgi:hypothetical protein
LDWRGFAVSVEAAIVIVTPGNPGSWNYETGSYGSTPGSYVANAPSTIPIVANPAAPGTGGSVQLLTTAGGANAAAYLSTTAYDGQSLSSITALGFVENTLLNNGQATPYLTITVANGAGGLDKLYFEPAYQTPSSGNPSLPNQGAVVLATWQTWNALAGGWHDDNGFAGAGTGVSSLAAYEALYPSATIADNSFIVGDGGISITAGWNGAVNQDYVNDVTINGTTYDFEPAPVPEPTTMVAGALLLLPFGASTLRMLRKKQTA